MAASYDHSRLDRWYFPKIHPYYQLGYCERRYGKVYLHVKKLHGNDKKLLKSLNKPWINVHKEPALKALTELIADKLKFIEEQKIKKSADEIRDTADLYERYAIVHFGGYSKDNLNRYTLGWKKFIRRVYSLDELLAITEDVSAILANYDGSPVTAAKYFEKVRSIFNFGVQQGWITRNPMYEKLKPNPKIEIKYTPREEEIRKMIQYFQNNENSILNPTHPYERHYNVAMTNLIRFIAQTGVRIHEALVARWSDYDGKTLTIHGKGSRIRHFPVTPFPALKELMDDMVKYRNRYEGFIFPWRDRAKPAEHLRNYLKKVVGKEDSEMYSFHGLRRYAVEKFVREEGLDVELAAQLLGHSTEIMRKHYLKILGPEQLEARLMARVPFVSHPAGSDVKLKIVTRS